MMKHMGFGALAVGLLACGSDGEQVDYNAADLMRAEQDFAQESCACAGAESQACLDEVNQVALTDCQLDAIMSEIEMAQDLVNCMVELYDDGTDCVRSAACELNGVVACSDMVVDNIDTCPMSTPAIEQAFAACG